MKNSKISELLHSFSKSELQQFQKYLRSPFFNENERLVKLFTALEQKLGADKEYTKKQLWKKVETKKPFNDTRFRRYTSDLCILAQNFLAYQRYQSRPATERNYLSQVLNERNLDKHFRSIERGTRKLQEENEYRDAEYFHDHFLLEQELDSFLVKNVKLTRSVNLEAADKMLDYYYLSKKLKNYCNALNYKNVLNLELKLGLTQHLLAHIEAEGYLKIPAIAIYYRIAQTLIEPEKIEHYKQLLALLQKEDHRFPQEEVRDMYIFAQNYCIKKINGGNPDFFRELFVIYQTLLEHKIIYKKGELLPWDYKNIVSIGLRLREFTWIEHFIQAYNHRLPKDFRGNALTYNLANLHFHQKRYEEVIGLLRTVEYKGLYYALDGRWLLLKTYYELQEFDAMESLLESFRIFLLRNKLLSKTNQRSYLNLIRFVRQLLKIGFNDKKKSAKLLEKINQAKEVAERKWLREKILGVI